MLVQILLIIIGFFFTYKGAGLLVDGSSSLAYKLKFSATIIGMTVVAFGTSLPELFITLFSNYLDLPEIGIGNIIGANITSILLIIGFCAIIYPIAVKNDSIRKELPLAIFSILLFIILANNFFTSGYGLGRIDGLIMLACFIIFVYYSVGKAKSKWPANEESNWGQIIAYIIIGMTALLLGSNLVVLNGTKIASALNLSNAAIGLSIIAFGTTLPEFFASIIAARKNGDLAIGNIVGSILFNMLFILGLSSLLNPMPYNSYFNITVIIALTSLLLIYYFTLSFKDDRKIKRWEGSLLMLLYIAYLGLVFTKF